MTWGVICTKNYGPDLTKSYFFKSCCKFDKESKFRLPFCIGLTKVKSQKEVGVSQNLGSHLYCKLWAWFDKESKFRLQRFPFDSNS